MYKNIIYLFISYNRRTIRYEGIQFFPTKQNLFKYFDLSREKIKNSIIAPLDKLYLHLILRITYYHVLMF